MPQPVYNPWLASDSLSFKPFKSPRLARICLPFKPLKAHGWHTFTCLLNHSKPVIGTRLPVFYTIQSSWLHPIACLFIPFKPHDWHSIACLFIPFKPHDWHSIACLFIPFKPHDWHSIACLLYHLNLMVDTRLLVFYTI